MGREGISLEVLSTRAGFNSAVRHINKTLEISGIIGTNNLGDILYERADENLFGERGAVLLRMLLIDKLGYKTASSNLRTVISDTQVLAKEFEKWKAVDLVVAYHHPDLGLLIANPKIAGELVNLGKLRKRELLVIYSGKGETRGDAQCLKAAELALSMFEGNKVKTPADLLKGNFAVRKVKKLEPEVPGDTVRLKVPKPGKPVKAGKPAPAGRKLKTPPAPVMRESARVAPMPVTAATPAISGGAVRMTPMYSVVVSNELFHNGNVEAWKRIIASYRAKYPDLQVFIYYDGERILDINTLFKWGKVKHGSAIQFAVSGTDIKDVAKLQRYFVQAASSRFETFLQGPVNTVLQLFG
ncbi:MAG: hypothetical protein FWG77_11645 [Treponema sp.]|nr:hypothetical protein [Treponema sp.]